MKFCSYNLDSFPYVNPSSFAFYYLYFQSLNKYLLRYFVVNAIPGTEDWVVNKQIIFIFSWTHILAGKDRQQVNESVIQETKQDFLVKSKWKWGNYRYIQERALPEKLRVELWYLIFFFHLLFLCFKISSKLIYLYGFMLQF